MRAVTAITLTVSFAGREARHVDERSCSPQRLELNTRLELRYAARRFQLRTEVHSPRRVR